VSIKKAREKDRAAIEELAIGVLGKGWVKATDLAQLVGVSVQQLHAALKDSVKSKVLAEKIVPYPVGKKHGELPRAFYKRVKSSSAMLPEWLSPTIVPNGGTLRVVTLATDDEEQ
jgi:hypothetical protein